MAILETEALTRRFGGLTAVDALTVAVERGEVFPLSYETDTDLIEVAGHL